AQLAGAHVKLVRNLIDVRSRLWLYLETLVACFFHCVQPKSICTNRQTDSKRTSKFKVSGVPAGQMSTDRTRDFCSLTSNATYPTIPNSLKKKGACSNAYSQESRNNRCWRPKGPRVNDSWRISR